MWLNLLSKESLSKRLNLNGMLLHPLASGCISLGKKLHFPGCGCISFESGCISFGKWLNFQGKQPHLPYKWLYLHSKWLQVVAFPMQVAVSPLASGWISLDKLHLALLSSSGIWPDVTGPWVPSWNAAQQRLRATQSDPEGHHLLSASSLVSFCLPTAPHLRQG